VKHQGSSGIFGDVKAKLYGGAINRSRIIKSHDEGALLKRGDVPYTIPRRRVYDRCV